MNSINISDIQVARAADDLRRGLPVCVCAADSVFLISALETMDGDRLVRHQTFAGDDTPFILITDNRAAGLKVGHKGRQAVRLEMTGWMTAEDLVAIADPTCDLATPLKGPFSRLEPVDETLEVQALKLVKAARLLPALLVSHLACVDQIPEGLLQVTGEAIDAFDDATTSQMKQVASARVPLADAEEVRLISFRPVTGGLEHIAILVGKVSSDEPVLLRIHSECFTGDLLASLKCDCGDQLRGAIKSIATLGGGILLYLAQEGRGIGLVSKLKAYALQDQGYDTVDANLRLGFDMDERVFAPAADILRQLHIQSVRLMTNNPEKMAALKRQGIKVAERLPHSFDTNPHNMHYLHTKKTKSGHLL